MRLITKTYRQNINIFVKINTSPIIHYLLREIYVLYAKLGHLCENAWAPALGPRALYPALAFTIIVYTVTFQG